MNQTKKIIIFGFIILVIIGLTISGILLFKKKTIQKEQQAEQVEKNAITYYGMIDFGDSVSYVSYDGNSYKEVATLPPEDEKSVMGSIYGIANDKLYYSVLTINHIYIIKFMDLNTKETAEWLSIESSKYGGGIIKNNTFYFELYENDNKELLALDVNATSFADAEKIATNPEGIGWYDDNNYLYYSYGSLADGKYVIVYNTETKEKKTVLLEPYYEPYHYFQGYVISKKEIGEHADDIIIQDINGKIIDDVPGAVECSDYQYGNLYYVKKSKVYKYDIFNKQTKEIADLTSEDTDFTYIHVYDNNNIEVGTQSDEVYLYKGKQTKNYKKVIIHMLDGRVEERPMLQIFD